MGWAKIANIKGPKGDPGPQAVSANAGNQARLGTDHLIFVPAVTGFLTQTAADARYALKTAIPSLAAYITTAAADARYVQLNPAGGATQIVQGAITSMFQLRSQAPAGNTATVQVMALGPNQANVELWGNGRRRAGFNSDETAVDIDVWDASGTSHRALIIKYDGCVQHEHETQPADPSNTAVTKGYVDSKVKIYPTNGAATTAAHSLPDETIVMVVP